MDVDIDVDEMLDLSEAFGRHHGNVPGKAHTLVLAETAHGMGLAIANAPHLTGNLRFGGTDGDGITMDPPEDHGGVIVGEFGPTASYASYVESGTSRMAPRRYVARALESVAKQFPDRITSLIDPFGGR